MQPLLILAQSNRFQATRISDLKSEELTHHFKAYSAYQLDLPSLAAVVHQDASRHQVSLDLPGFAVLDLNLIPNDLKADDYVLTMQTAEGIIKQTDDGVIKTFAGDLGGGKYGVSLTIDDDFMLGIIQQPHDQLMIVPLRFYVDDAPADAILVYLKSDLLEPDEPHACGAIPSPMMFEPEMPVPPDDRSALACLDVQVAFADDWLMFDKYNESVTDVENHNLAVINNVQNNYDDEFADEYVFVVMEIWISMCNTCDPWTSSTDAGALLSSFSNWAGNGFSNQHDIANLWTDR
ncbi:MAG: hypothetical protein R3330_12290, partial [Saprospiraceae bacterium]|nr:hypothetical protein [Saprospiraceae bacterium]